MVKGLDDENREVWGFSGGGNRGAINIVTSFAEVVLLGIM